MFIRGEKKRRKKEKEIISLLCTNTLWENVELTVYNTDGTVFSFHFVLYCTHVILINLSTNLNVCLHTVKQVLFWDALFSGLDMY